MHVLRAVPLVPKPGEACLYAFDRELDYLFWTLQRLGARPSDTEDLLQDIFAVLHSGWSTLDTTRPLRPWLFGIAFRMVRTYDPFAQGAPDHVFVRITPGIGAIDGHIEWRDFAGRWAGDQTLPVATKDCHHLVRALAAALAVQIQLLAMTRDPGGGMAAPGSTGPPPQASAPQSVLPPVPRSTPARISSNEPPAATLETKPSPPSTPRGPGPVLATGAGTSVGFGMSSSPVLLGRVFGSLAWQHVSVELAAETTLPTTTRRSDGAGFSQQHLLASAAACVMPTRWRACLLTNAGEVRMTGEEIDLPTSAVVPLVEVGVRVGVVQLLGRGFFVDAHADGLLNVSRWTGALDQVPVWSAPRLAAVVGIDIGIDLGGAHVH